MNKQIPAFILLGIALMLFSQKTLAQGCVAIRPMGCGGANLSNQTGFFNKGEWRVAATYRYFQSYKHFRGDHEEKERVENGTEVINDAHSMDLGLSYSFTDRFSMAFNLPFIYYKRSSLYEHYGNSPTTNPDQKRFSMNSKGIGDLRLSANYWLLDPHKHMNGNVALGLGIKLPTGNSNAQGDFHKLSSEGLDSIVTRAADQSIQLGDGGVGFTVEAQAYQTVFQRGALYFSGFYMFNPKTQNETLTRGTLNNVDPLIAHHSIADQYAVRLGLNYVVLPQQNLSLSLGGRAEGIPAKDAIGKSDGFRRPGYVVSAEPGLTWAKGNCNLTLNVPLALYRNRVKSVYDLADPTGERHGDAAFADYSINAGVVWRFGGHKMAPVDAPTFKNVTN